MIIQKGLWYLCAETRGHFTKGYWYCSPGDNYLNGDDDKPHFVKGYRSRRFTDPQEIRIKEPKLK